MTSVMIHLKSNLLLNLGIAAFSVSSTKKFFICINIYKHANTKDYHREHGIT